MQRTVRLPILLTLATVLVLTQQACSSNTTTGTASAPNPAASESTPETPAPQDSATVPSTTGTEPSRPTTSGTTTPPTADTKASDPTTQTTRSCRLNDLAVTFIAKGYDDQTDTMGALVTATNTSSRPCRAPARIIPMLGDAHGDLNEIPDLNYDTSAPAGAFTIKPGATAYQAMTWHICDKGEVTCNVGNWMGFRLGKATATREARLVDFPDPEKSNITIASMDLGELQQKAADAVIWGE